MSGKHQPIDFGLRPQLRVWPEQVKGSDGVYLNFTPESEPDPLVRAAAIAILLQTAWVAVTVAVKALRR